MSTTDVAVRAYRDRFGCAPRFAATAPGRVELMGNHTDYNGGLVLTATLDKSTVMVGSPTGDDTITLVALDLCRTATTSVSQIVRDPANTWADYVYGVVDQLRKIGMPVLGFRAVIHSDVPIGAGLSSSAALEVAAAYFLKEAFAFAMAPWDVARLCRRAENEYVGVACGILDQFSAVFGEPDSLLFLDCLTLQHDVVKIVAGDIAIVVCDSGVKHALTGGHYNRRRAECMAAAAHFGQDLLRNVPWEEFVARETELPPDLARRARHVLAESHRVAAMGEAVRTADVDRLRALLSEAHASCRDLFENSTPEIDSLVETASAIDGCLGAKLTGGGWGGCTVNLVHGGAVETFAGELVARYRQEFHREARIYPCRASAGARAVSIG
jgi:galactokinase